jgi:PAS domain-containing protein
MAGAAVRRTPIRRQSAGRRRQQAERRRLLEQLVEERGPWCQAQLIGCEGQAVDGHEVLPRSAGGSITDADGIVLLCRLCHRHITENPAWARKAGWTRSRYEGGAA